MSERWVNLAELSAETGFATRSLQYIRTREPGVLISRENGKVTEYKQPDCAINLRLREGKSATKEPDKMADFRSRRLEAETRLAELELEEAEGRVIPLTDHEERLAAICERIRAVLMTVPSKYLGRIQVTRTDMEAQAVGEAIRDELLLALQGTADDLGDNPVPVVEGMDNAGEAA